MGAIVGGRGLCCFVDDHEMGQRVSVVEAAQVAHDGPAWIPNQARTGGVNRVFHTEHVFDMPSYGYQAGRTFDSKGADEHVIVDDSGESGRIPWPRVASKWRWLLRTCQSVVAMCLYGVSTFIRSFLFPQQHLFVIGFMPIFALSYHMLAFNRAGGYYDTLGEMATELPVFLGNFVRRGDSNYLAQIVHERQEGIVRTVNGLETGVLFVAVTYVRFASGGLQDDGLTSRCVETLVFFILHRLLGANVLRGRYMGLLQPEAMWRFECDSLCEECYMRPLQQHPHPSY